MPTRIAEPETARAVKSAASALRSGALVGMPTETVYGLAADAGNPKAVARIFAAKGRPSFNPLISHVASLDMAAIEAEFGTRIPVLAERRSGETLDWPFGPSSIKHLIRH